jgi:hypothetical protein
MLRGLSTSATEVGDGAARHKPGRIMSMSLAGWLRGRGRSMSIIVPSLDSVESEFQTPNVGLEVVYLTCLTYHALTILVVFSNFGRKWSKSAWVIHHIVLHRQYLATMTTMSMAVWITSIIHVSLCVSLCGLGMKS